MKRKEYKALLKCIKEKDFDSFKKMIDIYESNKNIDMYAKSDVYKKLFVSALFHRELEFAEYIYRISKIVVKALNEENIRNILSHKDLSVIVYLIHTIDYDHIKYKITDVLLEKKYINEIIYILKHYDIDHIVLNYTIYRSIENEDLEMIKHMVEYNDLSIKTRALEISARKNKFNILKYLVELGADIHVRSDYPLVWATENGNFEMVKYLVEKGANIHVEHNTPLRLAARNGHLEIVKFLVENGADVHAENEDALETACLFENHNVAEYLVEQGANIDVIEDSKIKKLIMKRLEMKKTKDLNKLLRF